MKVEEFKPPQAGISASKFLFKHKDEFFTSRDIEKATGIPKDNFRRPLRKVPGIYCYEYTNYYWYWSSNKKLLDEVKKKCEAI